MRLLFQRYPRLLLALFIFFTGIYIFIRWGLPQDAKPWNTTPPEVSNTEEESCITCHTGMTGFTPAHDPQLLGCASCHLGHPGERNKKKAHRDMVLVPGNLNDVYQTCGTAACHQDIAGRVEKSLMSTMAGVITVDRFVFGESDTLTAFAHVRQLSHASPADQHLRHLCASCHLGNEKEHPGPVTQRSRGGGCNACHLNYNAEALAGLQVYQQDQSVPRVHPALTLEVRNEHCFGCHSRSGRISTNYEGWHETQLTPEEVKNASTYRTLADQRVFTYISPDIHHQKGLECIDCHHVTEIMGDGNIYLHQEDAVVVKCEDCHLERPPSTVPFESLSIESKKILALRQSELPDHQFVVGRDGTPFVNVLMDANNEAYLLGKNSGKRYPLKRPAAECTRESAHRSLSCDACHTAWAPQCVGCHNSYNPDAVAFDLLDKKKTKGKWEEYLGEFFAEPPTLGVVEKMDADSQSIRKIKTFVPGMIMTIDRSEFGGFESEDQLLFHRLFAPTTPHTTAASGRNCQSCHNNPLAIGYGRGELSYEIDGNHGKWKFSPEYVVSEYDQLPQDAWIGFLNGRQGNSTRPNARPFTIAEQRRILQVGACLTCHDGNSRIMTESLTDYESALRRMTEDCILPVWEQQ